MRAMSDHLSVIHQTLPSAFATEARLLVAAERRGRIELVESVRPNHTRLEQRTHLENPRALVGPNTGRQSVHGVVGFFDGLLERAKGQHAEHRAKDFFTRDAVTLRHAREYRRFEVEPTPWQRARRRLIHL